MAEGRYNSAFDTEDLAMSLPPHQRNVAFAEPHSPSAQRSHHRPQQPHPGGFTEANASPSQVRNNQRLGQYKVVKTLGEGSFGKVKLAVHAVSGQQVALKIISRKRVMQKDMQGRVEREIQYLQLLRHPHIIKL